MVTGHTGFKGSWLSLWLTRLGAQVFGFANGVPTQPNHFEALGLGIEEMRGDIADAQAVGAAIDAARPEIVFHLAAQSLVRVGYSDPVGTYRTNVIGTLNLLECCRGGDVSAVVSATTDKVYRNREWEWGYREIDELGGSDPYSASKSCVELMTRSYSESFLRGSDMLVASVRAGNVIGGGDWAEDRLIPDIIRAAFGGEVVKIRNPEASRPWQHVLDPLAGYLSVGAHLLDGDREVADAWNFGPQGKESIRVRDILGTIERLVPRLGVEIESQIEQLHECRLLQLDSSKSMARLGWRPAWEGEMLERTIAWYRAFYEEKRLISNEQIETYSRELLS